MAFAWGGVLLGFRELETALKIFVLSACTPFCKLKMDSPKSESKATAAKHSAGETA